jgi:hypothetical protein
LSALLASRASNVLTGFRDATPGSAFEQGVSDGQQIRRADAIHGRQPATVESEGGHRIDRRLVVLRLRITAAALVAGAAVGALGSAAARAQGPAPAMPGLTQAALNTLVTTAQRSGSVEAVEAAAGTVGGAEGLVVPQALPASPAESLGAGAPEAGDPSAPASLVVMHGRFVDAQASVPHGASPPSGSVMAFVVDATGRPIGQYVGDTVPRLSSLGAVAKIVPVRSEASAAAARRLGRLTFHRGPRRARAATWGNNCKSESLPENRHCYMIAVWHMEGGEEVEGTESEQDTTNMNVPTWASGDFVTDEEWAGFTGAERWTEVGQQGGHGVNCCEVWWFYAMSFGPHQFWTSGRIWQIPAGQYANYGMKSIGNGDWCFTIGPTWETTYACDGGFDVYSKELQVGMEIGAESKPVNSGSDYVNATWTDGSIHTWNNAFSWSNTSGVCYSHNGPYPGNINYGTC